MPECLDPPGRRRVRCSRRRVAPRSARRWPDTPQRLEPNQSAPPPATDRATRQSHRRRARRLPPPPREHRRAAFRDECQSSSWLRRGWQVMQPHKNAYLSRKGADPKADQSLEGTESYARRTRNTISATTRIKTISPPPIYMSTAFPDCGTCRVHSVGLAGWISHASRPGP
jgi:hypothetical protein